MFQIIEMFVNTNPNELIEIIENRIKENLLSKTNAEAYNNFKLAFNNADKSILDTYILSCYSFSNIIRFNSGGDFNVPFGSRQFSSIMKKNIPLFYDAYNKKNFTLYQKDFEEIEIPKNSFVYIDPPYLGTGAIYNENDGWNKASEERMYKYIEDLNTKNIKFAISNDLSKNKLIFDWAQKNNFTIIDIQHSYQNAFYQVKRKEETKEVLIVNYDINSL